MVMDLEQEGLAPSRRERTSEKSVCKSKTEEAEKEKGLENFEDSPKKRVRRQIVQELEESDEESSSNSESSGEDEDNIEDQDSLDFVQKLANELTGDEKESKFTEAQLDVRVIEELSDCTMTLR